MNEPVRVRFKQGNAVIESTVERQYADDNDLEVLPNESVWAHGRLRGPSRKNGRPLLPATDIPKAIPSESSGDQADDTPKENA